MPIKIFNTSAEVLKIPPGIILCQLEEVNVLGSVTPLTDNKTATFNQQSATRSNHFNKLIFKLI